MTRRAKRTFKGCVAEELGYGIDNPVFLRLWHYIEGDRNEGAWDEEPDATGKDEVVRDTAESCERILAFHEEAKLIEDSGDVRRRSTPSPVSAGTSPPDWPFYAAPSEAENERARGVGAYYAALAREENDVVRFRREILGNTPLPPDAVGDWISSAAAQYLTPNAYAMLRERHPPPDHPHVEVVGIERLPGLPPREHLARLRDGGTGETMTSRLVPPAGTLFDSVMFRDAIGELYEGMTLMHLRECGDRLARLYGWNRDAAMWFILTDIAPAIHPINVEQSFSLLGGPGKPWTTSRQEVIITLAPWVSERTLVAAYRRLRRDMRGKEGRTSLKTLTLFRFIMEHDGLKSLPQRTPHRATVTVGENGDAIIEPAKDAPHFIGGQQRSRRDAVPWTARMREWNELHRDTHADWTYKKGTDFRNAFHDTARGIIGRNGITGAMTDRWFDMGRVQRKHHASDAASPYHSDDAEEDTSP